MVWSGLLTGVSIVVLLATTCGGIFVGLLGGVQGGFLGAALGALLGLGIAGTIVSAFYRMLAADYVSAGARRKIAALIGVSCALSTCLAWLYWSKGGSSAARPWVVSIIGALLAVIVAIGRNLPSPDEDRHGSAP